MSLISNISKRFESEQSFTFNEMNPFSSVSSWVSTGSPHLDLNFETHGWPVGIIEVRGESQSGKTTLSLNAMKSCLETYRERAIVCILSSERRDNKPYAIQMGVDVDSILVHRVTTIEDVFNKIFQTVKNSNDALLAMFREDAKSEKIKVDSKEYDEYILKRRKEFGKLRFFFVWDALGQTVSSQELAKAKANAAANETKMAALGSAARALSTGLRATIALQDEEDLTLMIINRPYDKVDGTPGKKSYGGKAITLFPTIRVELARIQGLKVSDEEIGQVTKVTMMKTDFTKPKQKFTIEIAYGLGMVINKEDIELGIKEGILEKFGIGGASFMGGKLKWKTRRELYKLYEEKNKFLRILIKKLTVIAHNKVLESRK